MLVTSRAELDLHADEDIYLDETWSLFRNAVSSRQVSCHFFLTGLLTAGQGSETRYLKYKSM